MRGILKNVYFGDLTQKYRFVGQIKILPPPQFTGHARSSRKNWSLIFVDKK